MKINWLSRMLLKGPRIVLCMNDKEYQQVIKYLVVHDPDPWLADGCGAMVHHFQSSGGGQTACVCIDEDSFAFDSPIVLASVITHESVHIWQRYKEYIGEDAPCLEIEAYAIENISKTLMEEYASRIKLPSQSHKVLASTSSTSVQEFPVAHTE
jgi:hypothetical protein